ncbi:hypothetical protein K3495_g15534 [Podosphaera aphanis]|nr:hypothetical protein K3495_g15534 [Podosphaera aphanis]
MDNRARESKALKTARAQNCVAQANATKYPADASAALAAQEAKEREVQVSRISETCAESAYDSRCPYESARAGVKKQATCVTVLPESSSNDAGQIMRHPRNLSVENSEENNSNLYDIEDDEQIYNII